MFLVFKITSCEIFFQFLDSASVISHYLLMHEKVKYWEDDFT